MNFWDEGVPLNGSLRMFNGERAIRDFFSYPPGRYIVFYMAMAIGGKQVLAPRIAMALLTALFAALIWLAARNVGLKYSALIPVVLYLLMPMYYFYRFFSFCVLISVFIIEAHIRPLTHRKAITMGLLGVFVIWTRLELGLFLLITIPCLGIYNRYVKKTGSLFLNMEASLILIFAQIVEIDYVGGLVSWIRYLRNYQTVVEGGIKHMSIPWPPLWSIDYLRSLDPSFIFQDFLIYLTAAIILIGCGVVFFSSIERTSHIQAVAAMSFISYGLVVWRTGYGNLLRSIPPVSILAIWLIIRCARYKLIVFSLSLLLMFGIVMDSLWINPVTYQSIGIVRLTTSSFLHPRFAVRVHPDDCRLLSELVSTLEVLKQRGYQSLVALPFHPLFNYITGLTNPTYFEWLLPGMFNSSGDCHRAILNVTECKPDIVILNDEAFDGLYERRFSNQFPELILWMGRDYYLWQKISNFDIYLRKQGMITDLLDENNCDQFYSEGKNRIENVTIAGKETNTLIQSGNARLSVNCQSLRNQHFYSMIFVQSKNTLHNVSCHLEISMDGIQLRDIDLPLKERYFNVNAYLPDTGHTLCQLDLTTVWSDEDENRHLVWLHPTCMEATIPGFVVDRYCHRF
ncbi:hypothetical protein JW823_09575 [bacterium]|nr:hypothetical protein [candidate division CSSED10-310 bacterium]